MQIKRNSTHAAAWGGVLTAAALAAMTTTPAHAADAGGDIPGYQSAQKVLQTQKVKETVSRFFGAAKREGSTGDADGGMQGGGPTTTAGAPQFDLQSLVPIYAVSPEFVLGKVKGALQEGLGLSFLASRVTASDGQKASVLLSPKGQTQNVGGATAGSDGWQLSGIRDGDREVTFAESGAGSPHIRTFTEPQINAWYRLTDKGSVEPLNKEARTGLEGKDRIPLAEYQKLVKKRYGDKLPGSEYDRKGLAGGYTSLTPTGEDPQSKAVDPSQRSDDHWQLAALPGAAGLVAVGGAMYIRRRRTVTER
ncbi:hypothetical protein [Streptomyces sp. NPDC007205]|uniref:hypothetical protein n=1 Tax=Streptomyces sp. NPDC007205 TaxID=3154316 RepID=UPI00340D3514